MRTLVPIDFLRERGIAYHPEYLRKLEKDGKFPRRVPIGGGRAVLWDRDEILEYIAGRLAARGAYVTRVALPDTAA